MNSFVKKKKKKKDLGRAAASGDTNRCYGKGTSRNCSMAVM